MTWSVFLTTLFPPVRPPLVIRLILSRAADDVDFVYRIDVHQGPDNTVVASFELSGLKKDDVNIELHNDRLTVSGESKHLEERIEGGYAVRERRFGKFTRSLPVPRVLFA